MGEEPAFSIDREGQRACGMTCDEPALRDAGKARAPRAPAPGSARCSASIERSTHASSAMSTDPRPPDADRQPPRASLLQVIAAVFWSFFGVRRGKAMQRDAVTIRPAQVIVVGVILAAVLVVSLLLLVRFIIAHAH